MQYMNNDNRDVWNTQSSLGMHFEYDQFEKFILFILCVFIFSTKFCL
jgi:hypothetical protein